MTIAPERTLPPGNRRTRSARLQQRGGTIVGFLAGLIFGLMIAVFVAIFVTRAPVPFVNKVGKAAERVPSRAARPRRPDPNKPLYSKARPGAYGGRAGQHRGAARRTGGRGRIGSPGAAPPTGPAPAKVADADRKDDKLSYVLQAGAYRSQDDADGMKAKLALIGYEARVIDRRGQRADHVSRSSGTLCPTRRHEQGACQAGRKWHRSLGRAAKVSHESRARASGR